MEPSDIENQLVQQVKKIAKQDGSSVIALAGKDRGRNHGD